LAKHFTILDARPWLQWDHRQDEIYFDASHVNFVGNQLYAEAIFNFILAQGLVGIPSVVEPSPESLPITRGQQADALADAIVLEKDLQVWLAQVPRPPFTEDTPTIGCIVMNCNPFTLGHRYLTEFAARQVDWLYVLLVEADTSTFSFEDRFHMATAGVADLANVIVAPSGEYVISTRTFSAYSQKETLAQATIDASLDVEIFARGIAPALRITRRFAGEEPLDNVTRQYNAAMRRILPAHGIEFHVVPRKEIDGEPISASRVRAAFKKGDFRMIARLVPQTTLDFLQTLRQRYASGEEEAQCTGGD
jgi:[citrate (pro-3S)-lyase] ligase